MSVAQAALRVGNALEAFVQPQAHWQRLATGRVFHDLKISFITTYGRKRWHEAYDWMVYEWGLQNYIVDYEALRDS